MSCAASGAPRSQFFIRSANMKRAPDHHHRDHGVERDLQRAGDPTNTARWTSLSSSHLVICGRMPETSVNRPTPMPSAMTSWCGLTRFGASSVRRRRWSRRGRSWRASRYCLQRCRLHFRRGPVRGNGAGRSRSTGTRRPCGSGRRPRRDHRSRSRHRTGRSSSRWRRVVPGRADRRRDTARRGNRHRAAAPRLQRTPGAASRSMP